jgi:L-lactate dehydrogenase complex protein LldG
MAKRQIQFMSNSAINQVTSPARAAILKSIRDHLAQSAESDAVNDQEKAAPAGVTSGDKDSSIEFHGVPENRQKQNEPRSLIEIFREELEAVGGHCVMVRGEVEAAGALNDIIVELRARLVPARRIALSDAPLVRRLAGAVAAEVANTPNVADLFDCDVGITSAQAAIAETGTLVLESECERHRLVSLLPPVHIAIVNANDICLSLGEALRFVRRDGPMAMSRTITFITGPSRTADIELTLAIGVHGPKELYVIVCEETPPTTN